MIEEKSDLRVTLPLLSGIGRGRQAPRPGRRDGFVRFRPVKEASMKQNIRAVVRTAIEPVVTELGYRIWDVTYAKIGADYHLEVTIDSDRGIGIEDCEKVHRAIDPILDDVDPIENFYYLEVSSPGIERDIRTAEQAAFCVGMPVEAKLFRPTEDGRKNVTGTLLGESAEGVSVRAEDGEVLTLPRERISKLMTVYTDAPDPADGDGENE